MSDFILTNELISGKERPYRDVDLPAPFVGKKIRVMGLSAKEAAAFGTNSDVLIENGQVVVSSVPDDILARLLSKTLVDDKFERLFTDADVEKINELSAKLILMLANVAMELSGLREEDKGSAAKNSLTPDAALPTA